MKIIYICQYFPPEMGAPAARASELARYWVRDGHEVTVLTGFPNHPTGEIHPDYRKKFWRFFYSEHVDGIKVVRSWLLPFPNRKKFERSANYLSFALIAALRGSILERPDIIIATSPQMLVGLTGWAVRLIKGTPLIFEVRDLWPESLVDAGVARENSRLFKWVDAIASFLYKQSQHIVAVTPTMRQSLISDRNIPGEKISVVPNGVEVDVFTPLAEGENPKAALDLEGRYVISYIGTMGYSHPLTKLLEVAARLRDTAPDVLFLFVGEGAEKERLKDEARRKNLTNVRFMPQQPREAIPNIIRASDICTVLLKDGKTFKTALPSKMQEFMSCGRPVIVAADGEPRRLIEESGAGLYVTPEDVGSLMAAIDQIRRSPALARTLGANGARYAREYMRREQTAQKYIQVLEAVAEGRAPEVELAAHAATAD
jgi:glycosyltransferase involved in cell wall biosynthesis